MSKPEPDHAAALERLNALARARVPGGEPTPAAVHDAYARFRTRAARGDRARRPRVWTWAIPAVALGAVVVVAGWRALREPTLSVAVEGGALEQGGYVRAPAEAETAINFSDGTQVRLARSSRGRVAATSSHGARVRLDHGRAHVKVVPRQGNQWIFDAGPCRVNVTGTSFDMRWSDGDQLLEVLLYNGSVTVQGPPAPTGVTLRQGQRLVMDVRRGFARVERLPQTAPTRAVIEHITEPVPAAAPPAPPPPAEEPPREREQPAARPAARHAENWPTRVLAGEFQSVLQEAQRRGIDDVLRRESAVNLNALADAARYGGAAGLAQRTLTTVRKRFADTPQAQRAAFLLGRIAEDSEHDLAKALEWYGAYLADAPGGAYRAEALGRKMTATLKLHGAARARSLADEYMRRFPNDAYADAARAILASP